MRLHQRKWCYSRWLRRCYRVGLLRREWWIGVRHDLATECWEFGLFGLVLAVQSERYDRSMHQQYARRRR